MIDNMPYDPADPPADPPTGCADPVLWRVAWHLRDAHRPRVDNFCECRAWWPCPEVHLADESLRMAYVRWIPKFHPKSANIGRWSP